MKLVKDKISLSELKKMMRGKFGTFVKAVVDIKRKIMVVGGDLHADEETLLLQSGSKQEDLWGINLYPDLKENDWIEFDSMINMRPSFGHRSRGVDDPNVRKKITQVINKLVIK